MCTEIKHEHSFSPGPASAGFGQVDTGFGMSINTTWATLLAISIPVYKNELPCQTDSASKSIKKHKSELQKIEKRKIEKNTGIKLTIPQNKL